MAATSPEEARAALQTSQEQLAQVEMLLAISPGDAHLQELREAAREAVKLSQEVLQAFGAPVASTFATAAAAAPPPLPPLPPPPLSPPPSPPLPEEQRDDDGGAGAVFGIGSRIEVLSGAQWLPAWIEGAAPGDDGFVVRLFGSGMQRTVGWSSMRRLAAPHNAVPSDIGAGDTCKAVYAADGKSYDAVVTEVTPRGYKVKYLGYNEIEEVPYEYLRERAGGNGGGGASSGAAAAAGAVNRPAASALAVPAAALDEEGNFRVPENLLPRAGDTEAEKERKRRKIKALKSRVRLKHKEEETVQKQTSWKTFATGKGAKPARGSLKGLRKESIFKSPDAADGRVGVTGSGKGMTEFAQRPTKKPNLGL